jgi:hypothetical protein
MNDPSARTTGEEDRTMSTHIFGLTVAALADASHAARTIDHAVTLVDDASHVIVVVDQRGRVTMRMARRSGVTGDARAPTS